MATYKYIIVRNKLKHNKKTDYLSRPENGHLQNKICYTLIMDRLGNKLNYLHCNELINKIIKQLILYSIFQFPILYCATLKF